MRSRQINIAGAGLAGALLALLLARRGHAVTVYERRPDPRLHPADAGRSINLALAARGIRALTRAGIMERVRPLMIPMRGRMVHDLGDAAPRLLPYGQREHEVIYSISRAALNLLLIEEAARLPQVSLHFDTACTAVDPQRGTLTVSHPPGGGASHDLPLDATVATDGAGSALRTSLAAQGRIQVREEPLEHDYKEFTLPAREDDGESAFALEPHALHVWPRRGFMLIALPNPDRSFTATLFLPRTGADSFASLDGDAAVERFFRREFATAAALIPDLAAQYRAHPQGHLGTVHVTPWASGAVLLLGDAAHAIVPFHGQGMNAAFEDCLLLDELLDRAPGASLHGRLDRPRDESQDGPLENRPEPDPAPAPAAARQQPPRGAEDWPQRFARFEAARRPDAEAIARMALENYAEMRSHVLDEKFLRHKAMALALERQFPQRFIPRYSMVMFHPEIPYAGALRRGQVQQEILDTLDARRGTGGEMDEELARQLITARLAPAS